MKGKRNNYQDDSEVIIKPLAYYKMLVHVLRFGSKTRDIHQYKEVMGMLIGHLEGEGQIKNVIIEDVVPVTHGGSIEVTFSPEDYVSFSVIDEEFAKKDLFSVGWYHSHPGLDIFFSGTDIKNQLGWQNANPSAIGIVFDHTYLEKPGDLGFRTFRLTDPSRGEMSNYHEVKTKVEPPNDSEFYDKIIELISSVHSKDPPILELNEKPNVLGEITFPSKNQLTVEKPQINSELLVENLKSNFTELIETLLRPILDYTNNWAQNLLKNLVTMNLSMRDNLLNIKNTLNNQFEYLQTSFKTTLKNKLESLDYYVDDELENFDSFNNKFKTHLDDLNQNLDKMTEENLKKIENELEVILNERAQELEKLVDINQQTKEMNKKLNEHLTNLQDNLKLPGSIYNKIYQEIQEIREKANDSVEDLFREFQKDLIFSSKNIKDLSSKFDKTINLFDSSLEPLEDKINDLITEKQIMQNKLDKNKEDFNILKEEKENLEKTNKELEKDYKKLRKKNEKLKKQIEKLED